MTGVAYDAGRDRIVLFGGQTTEWPDPTYEDTWELTATADFDEDHDVDRDDYDIFEHCATGPDVPYDPQDLAPECVLVPDHQGIIPADFDRDSDVEQDDFAIFQGCYSGEGNPADPGCAE